MENKYWRWIGGGLALLLFLSIGYSAGYAKGSIDGIGLSVKVGFLILQDQDIQLEFSEKRITDLIFAYKNRINVCQLEVLNKT